MRRATLVILAMGWTTVAAAQPAVGYRDDFEGVTTQGWSVNGAGFGAPPAFAVPSLVAGGPTGQYMLLQSQTGGGSGSRLAVLNGAQWAGNYLTAGIPAIGMSVNNFGPSDLFLRLMFEDPIPGPPNNVAFSTNPIFVGAGSGWTNIMFPILPASLTAGLGTVNGALANATVLRLYHSQAANFPNPAFPIAPVTAQLGVDNITALAAVPEPATVTLVGVGVLALAGLSRRRRSR